MKGGRKPNGHIDSDGNGFIGKIGLIAAAAMIMIAQGDVNQEICTDTVRINALSETAGYKIMELPLQ